MSYFNDKEEILKIELTSFGKKLLSKGKFKPAFYAFFDDEIIYDSRYFDLSESQNSTVQRVLYETPTFKPQINFSSIEDKQTNVLQILNNETKKIISEQKQDNTEKKYSLSSPLGKSSYNSIYYPAWNITLLDGKISSSVPFIDNSNSASGTLSPFLRIPQINLSQSLYSIKINKDSLYEENGYTQLTSPMTGRDGRQYYFSLKEQNILIDITELNVDDLKQNFDIEVFIEEEKVQPGTNKKVTNWRQLLFQKKPIFIKDNILLDEPLYSDKAIEKDINFSDYYINILVDEEIELTPKQMAKLDTYSQTNNINNTPPAGPSGEDCT